MFSARGFCQFANRVRFPSLLDLCQGSSVLQLILHLLHPSAHVFPGNDIASTVHTDPNKHTRSVHTLVTDIRLVG